MTHFSFLKTFFLQNFLLKARLWNIRTRHRLTKDCIRLATSSIYDDVINDDEEEEEDSDVNDDDERRAVADRHHHQKSKKKKKSRRENHRQRLASQRFRADSFRVFGRRICCAR